MRALRIWWFSKMADPTSPLTDDIRKRVADIPGFVRWSNYRNSDYHVEVWMRFWTKVFTGARTPILDYGCGSAWCGFVGQHLGHTVTNLDIETEIREVDPTAYFGYFHEILGQTQDLWDGKKMPYEDNTFGAVVAKASLSKLVNSTWEDVVAELVRVTKPGGRWFAAPPYMITRLKKATGVSQLKAKGIHIVSWDWGWKDPRNGIG
jgi:SAM-dependent methyltransferase